MTRYALYFAPPPGDFATAAAQWLGRDTLTGADYAPLHPDLPALSASARRYGFHGTLKPPFCLAHGLTEQDLLAGIEVVGAALRPASVPGLRVAALGGFLALVPVGETAGLDALAGQIVTRLDRFRAPLTPADRARRNPDALSPRQRDLLDNWGYPYVLDEFRFHLTLTDRLTPDQAAALTPLAEAHFAPHLAQPLVLDAVAVFVEDEAGRFHQRHRIRLG